MKPPSTATSPRSSRAARCARRRSHVAPMSGAAEVCSASVTSTLSGIDPGARDSCVRDRGGDDAAADDFAGGDHGVERAWRNLAQHRQRVGEAHQLVELRAESPRALRALGAVVTRGGDGQVSLEQRLQRRRRRRRRRRLRRGGSPRSACLSPPTAPTPPRRAACSAAGCRSEWFAVCRRGRSSMSRADRVGVGDRRPAELHDDAHRIPVYP